MGCIWHLFFSIASLRSLESSAGLMDLSCFTVMTTGLLKTLSEHLSSLIICFVSYRWRISLSTLSVNCRATLRPLCWYGCISCFSVDFAIWFFDLPNWVHKWGYFFIVLSCTGLSS